MTRALGGALAAAGFLLAAPVPIAASSFPYDTLREGTVQVLHAPRHAALARETLATATRPLILPGLGRASVPPSTTIVLAPTPGDFAEAAGGRAPEWAGGVAIPRARRIVVPAYVQPGVDRRSAEATLRHEVVHLVLHETLPPPIPRWFDEGYAEIASGSFDVSAAWALRVAMLLGRSPPLDSLEMTWPREAGRARLAYLLSATMVDHLRRRSGEEGFALLLENWRREESLDRAVRITFGMTMGELEAEWRRSVRTRYGWLAVTANVGLLWLLAVALGMLALLPRRRRNRERLAAMEAEERMLPPPRPPGEEVDYPLGPPPDDDGDARP